MSIGELVDRFAALLVPGWKVTWETCPPDKMPLDGALAVCSPTPTRSLAHIFVVEPWPEGESLVETIAHELTHACLSPLTALLPPSGAAVMLEEQAVENIGNALAAAAPEVARAMARAVERYAPRLKGKLSALAPRARSGGEMDAKEVLAAITGQDEAKALEILTAWAAEQIEKSSGGATHAEPDGDEAGETPMEGEMAKGTTEPKPADASGAKPGDGGDGGYMRKAREAIDAEQVRARRAREELEIIVADQRTGAKNGLIEGLRARLPGHSGLPAIEKKILAAGSYQEAKQIAEIAEAMGGGAQRARSGVDPKSAPAGEHAPPFDVEELRKEGHGEQQIVELLEEHKTRGRQAADALLFGMRRGLARARSAQPNGKAVAS